MGAPVYKIGTKFYRRCYDGWIYELPSPNAHNYQGRAIGHLEYESTLNAIADGSAVRVIDKENAA